MMNYCCNCVGHVSVVFHLVQVISNASMDRSIRRHDLAVLHVARSLHVPAEYVSVSKKIKNQFTMICIQNANAERTFPPISSSYCGIR